MSDERVAALPLRFAPRPWVVLPHWTGGWIKDAEHEWVGIAYSEADAQMIVATVNDAAAPAAEAVRLLRGLNDDWHERSMRPCPTCDPISVLLGEPFGCGKYRLAADEREGTA